MKPRLSLAVAASSLLFGVVAAAAGAAPTPSYDVTCAAAGQTNVTWNHAKLDQVTLEWFDAGVTTAYTSAAVPITTHPPHGFVVTGAGVVAGHVAASVRVSFERSGGAGTDVVTADCTA